jgi:hypothetical protein
VLFVATATGVHALVLFTGALASVVLGPAWWVLVSRLIHRPVVAVAPSPELGLGAESSFI